MRALWRRVPRWMIRLVVAGVAAAVLAVVGCGIWVRVEAHGHLYSASDVPPAPVALVLGTQVEPDGTPGQFLVGRLELAKRLYDAGTVKVILVSGDHRQWKYDEPDVMRDWLVVHDVPDDRIVVDYAGFDTYDSCARAIRIFDVHRAIVVTQSFHTPRAVALCRSLGIDATGVGDNSVERAHREQWVISTGREWVAGVKAALDLLSGRDPVLGRPETGVDVALRS